MKTLTTICTFLVISFQLWSQDTAPKDTLSGRIEGIESDMSVLKKIKITGYIQAQYQKADEKGIESVSGDNFEKGVDQRFNIRRGRLKTTYTGKGSEIAFQLDLNEKGVGLKEAYLKFSDPWFKIASIQGGLYNRHFGFELPFSSTVMEAPERSRVIQTMLAGETDLGFSLILQGPKNHFSNAFKLEAGLFNGTNNKPDFDNYKDFIGRLSYKESFMNESLSLGLGASYYNGGMGNLSSSYYEYKDTAFMRYPIDTLTSMKREYYGVDGQLSFETPVGITTLRAELMMGQQAGLASSTKTPLEPAPKDKAIGATYLRDFQGGYLYFVQSLGNTKHNIVVKYDWYDPNTNLKGDEIVSKAPGGSNSRISKADVAYTTLGFGWFYNWNSNIRFTAYYDMVSNEKTKLNGYTEDNKDNVMTVRVLYKF